MRKKRKKVVLQYRGSGVWEESGRTCHGRSEHSRPTRTVEVHPSGEVFVRCCYCLCARRHPFTCWQPPVPAILGRDSLAWTLTVGLQWAVSVYVTQTSFIGSGAKPP